MWHGFEINIDKKIEHLSYTVLSHFSHVQHFAALWTTAHQAPLSKEFSRREYWNELPFPSQGDLSKPGTEPMSLMSPVLAGGFFTTSTPWEAPVLLYFLFQLNIMFVSFIHVFTCLCNSLLFTRISVSLYDYHAGHLSFLRSMNLWIVPLFLPITKECWNGYALSF